MRVAVDSQKDRYKAITGSFIPITSSFLNLIQKS